MMHDLQVLKTLILCKNYKLANPFLSAKKCAEHPIVLHIIQMFLRLLPHTIDLWSIVIPCSKELGQSLFIKPKYSVSAFSIA